MTKPLKIIHLIPGLGIGGTEKQVRLLLTHLDPARFSVQLWALKGWGPLGDRLNEKGIPVKAFGGRSLFSSVALIRRIARELAAEKPDILHTWLTAANAVGRLAARFSGADPVVLGSLRAVERNPKNMDLKQRFHIWLERRTRARSQIVTVNAEAVREFARNTLKIPGARIRFIPNGWEEKSLDSASTPLPQDWLRKDIRLIGSAGRLEKQKDFHALLKAFLRLSQSHPDIRLVIVGNGPLGRELSRQIAADHLTDRVVLAWALSDLNDFFSRIHLFVLPSRWEGFPNVILEAMAQGVPVVATDVGGVRELVTPETGTLVPPEDPAALAGAMDRTLSNLEEARRTAQKAVPAVREKYSMARTIRMTSDLYEELAGGR